MTISNGEQCSPILITMDIRKILYKYNAFDGNPEFLVRCSFSFYNCNGTLAFCMYKKPRHTRLSKDIERVFCEPYAKITINNAASSTLYYDEQFINETKMPEIGAWLIVNGIAKPTGKYIITENGILEAFQFNLPKDVYMQIKDMRSMMNTLPPSLNMIENQII